MNNEFLGSILILLITFVSFFLAGLFCSIYEERRRKKSFFLTVYYVMLVTSYVPPKFQPSMLRYCPYFPYLAAAILINQHFLQLASSTFINPMRELLSCKHLFYVTDRDIKRLEDKLHLYDSIEKENK